MPLLNHIVVLDSRFSIECSSGTEKKKMQKDVAVLTDKNWPIIRRTFLQKNNTDLSSNSKLGFPFILGNWINKNGSLTFADAYSKTWWPASTNYKCPVQIFEQKWCLTEMQTFTSRWIKGKLKKHSDLEGFVGGLFW